MSTMVHYPAGRAHPPPSLDVTLRPSSRLRPGESGLDGRNVRGERAFKLFACQQAMYRGGMDGAALEVIDEPPTIEAPPDELSNRRWLVFGIVSVALFMSSIDQTIVATALTAIQHDLHARINWSGWTITIYALGQVLVMPVAGKLSDQFGRKKIFLISISLFTVASLACGFADNIYVLVVLRAIQSIGGGGLMPSASGIVADQFGKDRDRALGMFASIYPIGSIVGPIAGGIFVATWSWRGIFLINVPIGLVLILMVVRFIPYSAPTAASKIDVRGVALLAIAVLSAMFGITWLGSGNVALDNPITLACEALALLIGWQFVRHLKRTAEPVIPLRFLHGRGFKVINIVNFIYGATVLGFGALVPLYAEQRYGIQPLEAGTLLTARGCGMICVAAIAVMALRRTGYRLPITVGFLIIVGGLVLMSLAPLILSPYAWLAVGGAIIGLGVGLSTPASNNASLQLAPDHIAAISGLRGMFRQSGGIMAVSIVTAILARSPNPGLMQAHILLVLAALLVSTLPLIRFIPEYHSGW
jgi:EmrB/QacA subfamily drug resistance transporter